MTVGADRIRDLIGRLAAESARDRGTAADSVTDWTQSFDESEASVISRVLLWLSIAESDEGAKEAQLHALAELAEWELVPVEVLRDVGQLAGTGLSGSSIEHFEYLDSLRAKAVGG
jgi:hypothetical protein